MPLPLRAFLVGATIGTFSMLAGCAGMGERVPPAKQVDVQALDAGSAMSSAANATPVWGNAAWWSVFGDPQLDQLVDRALAGNPTLRIVQARVREAQATIGSARSATLPAVQGEADLDRYHFTEHEFIPPPQAGNDYWDNKVLIEASYDLDLWGKNRSALAAAIDAGHAAEAESRAAQLSLQTSVVRAYLLLALDYALLEAAQATLDQQQHILDITRKRLVAGLGTKLEVSEAETQLPSSRADLEQIHESIAKTCNLLAALSGAGPGAGEQLTKPQLDLSRVPALPDAIPAHWVGQRPDIVAARWRVEAASKNIEVAKARFYPDINLTAFAGFQSLNFSELLTGDSLLTAFAPAITLPIFTGGKLRAQLAASDSVYDEAVESYNAAVITALQQTADQIITVRSLDVQLQEFLQTLASAQKSYDLALGGFRAGLTEYLSVLNTQTRLLDAQKRVPQLRAQQLDAYAVLVNALGGSDPAPQDISPVADTSKTAH